MAESHVYCIQDSRAEHNTLLPATLPHAKASGGRWLVGRNSPGSGSALLCCPPVRHKTLPPSPGNVLLLIAFHRLTQTSGSSASVHFLLLMRLPSQTSTSVLNAQSGSDCLPANNSPLTKSRARWTAARPLSRPDQSDGGRWTPSFI